MLIVKNNIIPTKTYKCLTIYPFVFVRRGTELTQADYIHEYIHAQQQKEMLIVGFYAWYLLEWLIKCIVYRNAHKAYRNISFERESYEYEDRPNEREVYGWIKFLK